MSHISGPKQEKKHQRPGIVQDMIHFVLSCPTHSVTMLTINFEVAAIVIVAVDVDLAHVLSGI